MSEQLSKGLKSFIYLHFYLFISLEEMFSKNKGMKNENLIYIDNSLDSYYPALSEERSSFVIGWKYNDISSLEKRNPLRNLISLAESK